MWAEEQHITHCIAHVGGHVASVQRPAKLKAALSALDLSVDDDGYIDVPQEEAVRLIIDHAKCWTVEVVSDAERGLLPVADGAAG